MVACVRVSPVMMRFVSLHGYLKARLINLWRPDRPCWRTARHFDPRFFGLPIVDNGRLYSKDALKSLTTWRKIETIRGKIEESGKAKSGKVNGYHSGSELR